MRVLLLEDQVALQKCTTRLIKLTLRDIANDVGLEVDVTDSVPKTIALLQHFHYDLVVSDYEVNWGTGGDVLKWVREFRPKLVDKFVFFSGSDEPRKLHDKYIEKGIPTDEFMEKLRRYVGITEEVQELLP